MILAWLLYIHCIKHKILYKVLYKVDRFLSQIPSSSFDLDEPLHQQRQEDVTSTTRFGPRLTSCDVSAIQKAAVPVNTRKSTNWAVNVWNEWSDYRKQQDPSDCPPHLRTMQLCELNEWLSLLVLEFRREDGKCYPPNTVHQLCCGILRYLREVIPSLDIFKDSEFISFRKTLDAQMKRLQRTPGIQTAPKRAEPISECEEDILWEKGLLGTHSPQVLIDTLVFMSGLYFALRSGEEHRQMRFSSIQLVEKPGLTPYLVYTELASKNNPGGLKHRKVERKQVAHYANTGHPDRCFVEVYKQYCIRRPKDVSDDVFYLSPISNPKGTVWFKKSPIGIHTLSATVKRLCEKAGIHGYKTNHSLRVTAATRFFQKGTDEQLIMQRTGHRSTDGVRLYKRSCPEQQELLSKVLNREIPAGNSSSEAGKELTLVPPSAFCLSTPSGRGKENRPPSAKVLSTPSDQEMENRPPAAKENTISNIPPVTFSECTGITINYNFGK